MRNLALWGEAAKALFWRPVRGFVVIFEQRKTWMLGLQEGNSSRAKAWSPWKSRAGKGEKGRLEDKASMVHHGCVSASCSSGAGKGNPQVFSPVQHLRRTWGRQCNLWVCCSQLHRGDKHANKIAKSRQEIMSLICLPEPIPPNCSSSAPRPGLTRGSGGQRES